MQNKRINILVTNDDGYQSPGIIALARALREVGKVTVVAPDRERSAIGHGLTFFHPLRLKKVGFEEDVEIYASDGTPTDCVLIGIYEVLKEDVDLVVSGINRGGNLGDDVTYSGTVSAAMEGAIQGRPSMAVSLATFEPDGDYSHAAEYAARAASEIIKHGLPEGTFLNVNVPAIPKEEIRGVRVTRQGRSIYKQKVVKRFDPRGGSYFWITGEYPTGHPEEGTDFGAIADNCISVTPLNLSMTDDKIIKELEKLPVFNGG